jgi:hypothetical protein
MTRPSNKLSKKLNKGTDGLSNNKKRNEAITAIGQLAKALQELQHAQSKLAGLTQTAVQGIEERVENSSIVIQAILNTIEEDYEVKPGQPRNPLNEKVAENAKKIRIKLVEDESAQQGEAVLKALAEGTLIKEETAKENTLLVTTIKKGDGSQTYPTKNYTPFASLKPEIQAAAKDKKVGDIIELPTEGGGTMEIIGIY